MGRQLMKELKEKADTLTIEEELELIDHPVHRSERPMADYPPNVNGATFAELPPHPLAGEDAQAWVKRSRE